MKVYIITRWDFGMGESFIVSIHKYKKKAEKVLTNLSHWYDLKEFELDEEK